MTLDFEERDGLTRDAYLGAPGFCGKGQTVPVGDGGPLMRIKKHWWDDMIPDDAVERLMDSAKIGVLVKVLALQNGKFSPPRIWKFSRH